MKRCWTILTVFRTHFGESFAQKVKNDSKHFLVDDSTCDSSWYFRKKIMKCFVIKTEIGKLEKLEVIWDSDGLAHKPPQFSHE